MTELPVQGPGSDRVSQATELISVQAKCGLDQAYDLLREKALMLGQTLEYTALDGQAVRLARRITGVDGMLSI